MNLRVVFFGTPNIAAQVLESLLLSGINIVGVVSRIDKPQKRSKVPQPSPVKLIALKYKVPLLQPIKASDLSFAEELNAFQADIFIVVAYGAILKKHILDIPKFGCINLHGSLLPNWRGAAPAQRAIMNGDTVSGITIIQMNEGMDTGDILNIKEINIPSDMISGELLDEMAKVGAPLLLETLSNIEQGKIKPIQQPAQGTLALKITKEDAFINWNFSAEYIYNQIRGVTPFPGAWCFVFNHVKGIKKRLLIKVARLDFSNRVLSPGEIIVNSDFVIVGCLKGNIQLHLVQLEGKNVAKASNIIKYLFENGYSLL